MRYINKHEESSKDKVSMHSGHRGRLSKELYHNKFVGIDDYKVLEYILFSVIPIKDTNPIAHQLISSFGSFANVCDADLEDLKSIKGMTNRAAQLLVDLPYILRNYQISKQQPKQILACTQDIFNYLGSAICHLPEEEFYAICLDNGNHVINRKMIARGTDSEVSVRVNDVVKFAISMKAKKVIFLHNHPTTSVDPSVEDLDTTQKLFNSLSFHNIELAEHLIVNYMGDCFSFSKSGMLKCFNEKVQKLMKF